MTQILMSILFLSFQITFGPRVDCKQDKEEINMPRKNWFK